MSVDDLLKQIKNTRQYIPYHEARIRKLSVKLAIALRKRGVTKIMIRFPGNNSSSCVRVTRGGFERESMCVAYWDTNRSAVDMAASLLIAEQLEDALKSEVEVSARRFACAEKADRLLTQLCEDVLDS